MNTQIFTRVMKYINFIAVLLLPQMVFAWTVDFSRHQSQTETSASPAARELNLPVTGVSADRSPAAVTPSHEEKSFVEKVFNAVVPVQDLVILNTEQGFVPSTLRVKEGAQYRIVVVNVNEKSRNVSFVLDAFSEHHATFYGKIKTFFISPKKEGVYSYISPETSAQGRLIVYPSTGFSPASGPAVPTGSVDARAPASE